MLFILSIFYIIHFLSTFYIVPQDHALILMPVVLFLIEQRRLSRHLLCIRNSETDNRHGHVSQGTRARGYYYFRQRCSVRIKENETADDARVSRTEIITENRIVSSFRFT